MMITLLIISMSSLTYTQGKISRNAHTSGNVKNSTTNKSNVSGQINGHDYVDLGLPSGLKWTTCNIGASAPQEYGNYFAWGMTSSKKN